MVIQKFNDYSDDIIFENIISEILLINESGKWVDERTYIWDINNDDKKESKLKSFLSNKTKEQVKNYFYKFLSKLKNVSSSFRKKIILKYTIVFMAFVPLYYLIPDNTNNDETLIELGVTNNIIEDLSDVKKELVRKKDSVEKRLKRKSTFNNAQNIVKELEAGYSGDRKDRGNFIKIKSGNNILKRFVGTNHGISAPVLQKFLGRAPKKEDMEKLSYETALKIFKNKYWTPQNLSNFCDQSVANIIYDGCVNQGINGMKSVLRNVYNKHNVKINDDENPFDILFIKKINKIDGEELFNSIKKERENRYKEARTFKVHGDGWLSRINSIDYKTYN